VIAHVAAATIAALVAIVATLALKRQRAAWRYAILLIAVLRFAIPTAWLAAAGGRLAPHVPTYLSLPDTLAPALLHPGAILATAPAAHATSMLWPLLWAFGALASFSIWGLRALRPLPAVREPSPEERDAFPGVPLRIVAPEYVPGAHGLFRQCVVLPEGLAQHLTMPEFRALVAHERAHIRRHDNLQAAIVHAIVSLFWFDPVLWWIERRMLDERERACDEMALAAGAEPEHYISGIAKVCCMSVAGAAGYAGATGANLHQRMEHIMSANVPTHSSRFLRVLAGALVATAALLPMGGAFLRAQTAQLPSDPDLQAGIQMLAAKNYGGAYEAFARSRQFNPTSLRGLGGMVEVDMAQGRMDDAIALLKPELEKNPGSVGLRQMAGNTLTRAGRYDEAIRYFQSLITPMTPPAQQADAYLRLGEAYRRKGDDGSSIAALQTARRLAPDNPTVVSTLALVLDHAGRRDDAALLYREAIRVNSKNGVAMNNLAYSIAESGGDLDQALDLAKKARELLPNILEPTDTLGWIYLKRKDFDAAVGAFADIVGKAPNTRDFRTHLALALESRGDSTPATLELIALLRSTPNEENRNRVLELLPGLAR
jgi:beta-lactamase regulating signal transducer with metallopeptidase domain/Tfp pilus assembly protein PilF